MIHAWRRAYPIDVFETLWKHIDSLIQQERMIASLEVYKELSHTEDELFEWAKVRHAMFVDLEDDVQGCVLDVMTTHAALVNVEAKKSRADPFVIAVAMARGATVLTQETTGGGKVVKIPDVCAAKGIKCCTLLDFIRKEGLRF